ncbi:MAG: virulence protein [Oscillospiraceae bacterium]|nr:virulence protein [Oscillospiraceae bacterium]
MEIHVELGERKRKELAVVLGAAFGTTPSYKGPPSYAYDAGRALIDQQGVLTLRKHSRFDKQAMEKMLAVLTEHGFKSRLVDDNDEAKLEATDKLTIQIPLDGFEGRSIENLRLLVASKATLIKKALGVCNLSIQESDGTIDFPWFDRIPTTEETAAYTQFITAMCDMAKRQQRILAVEKPTDNEKFTFRLFLVRLGMKGEEFAEARRILLRDLTGNGNWKDVEGRSTQPRNVKSQDVEASTAPSALPASVPEPEVAEPTGFPEEAKPAKRKFSLGTMLRRLKGLGCV